MLTRFLIEIDDGVLTVENQPKMFETVLKYIDDDGSFEVFYDVKTLEYGYVHESRTAVFDTFGKTPMYCYSRFVKWLECHSNAKLVQNG